MVDRIIGLVFLLAAAAVVWKLTSLPNKANGNKKHSSDIVRNYKNQKSGENSEPVSAFVENVRVLMDQQTDLTDLSENIQKITMTSHLENEELNTSISKSLDKIAVQTRTAPYLIETDVFDMNGPESVRHKKRKSNNPAPLPDKVIFQFSIVDARSGNKVGEFAATYELAMVAPELVGDSVVSTSAEGKKKPDETYASPGSK